ncbi:retrovirus-related pol polyprotein from transposon TNT 1-94 [Tanacetum coccineum]
MGYKKKAVVVTSDPLALVAEKTKVSKHKEKVVVQSESEGSDDEDINYLKKIIALLAKAFNRKKYYAKPTNNNLRTSSANKKPEYVKSEEKKEDNKADEKKRDMSKVKCYNCKKEGHFSKDCKKAKVKDYNYYKTKMLLAKKDGDEQVLLAEDQAWMESSSDSDQEISANMVFMAKMEKLEEYLRKKDSEKEYLKSKVVDFTMVQNLQVQVKELQSENEHLKSKYIDFVTFQTLQVQFKELKSVNESLNLSIEELYKARALSEATLRERYELIAAQCKKMRLLEEQYESFHEVQFEFDLEIVHDTQDNSKNDLIFSLQTQLKETAELVVQFSDEKYFALKEIKSLKDEIKSLQTENKVLRSGESELSEKIDQMKSQVSELLEKL